MARRDELLDLLRPPAHRGPLIASGAVLFTLGIALEEQRLDDTLPNGLHVVILALAAGLMLGLGLQAPLEGGRPAAYQSVLLVSGLLLLGGALLELAHALGGDYPWSAASLTWTALLLAAAALHPARTCRSAICGMIAALALGVAFLALIDWIFGPTGQNGYRWLLLLISLVAVLASLALRGSRPRQGELLVIVAGLATLAIAGLAVTNVLISLFGFGPDATLLPGWGSLSCSSRAAA